MQDFFKKLTEPFDEEDLEWRCGAATADKTKCLALVYVTNRAIMNRLDEVAGADNWQTSFRRHGDKGVVCTLSICLDGKWVHKEDGAEDSDIESVKGGISDSMKRAAVQWGIGRYLYNAEASWEPSKSVGKSTVLVGRPKLRLKARTIKITPEEACKKLSTAKTLEELKGLYTELPPNLKTDVEVLALKEELKNKLK